MLEELQAECLSFLGEEGVILLEKMGNRFCKKAALNCGETSEHLLPYYGWRRCLDEFHGNISLSTALIKKFPETFLDMLRHSCFSYLGGDFARYFTMLYNSISKCSEMQDILEMIMIIGIHHKDSYVIITEFILAGAFYKKPDFIKVAKTYTAYHGSTAVHFGYLDDVFRIARREKWTSAAAERLVTEISKIPIQFPFHVAVGEYVKSYCLRCLEDLKPSPKKCEVSVPGFHIDNKLWHKTGIKDILGLKPEELI